MRKIEIVETIKDYDDWKDGACFLTDEPNPVLTVVRENGTGRWLNHCYFEMTGKRMNDYYLFAVYENETYRGTYSYIDLRDILLKGNKRCSFVARPRKLTKSIRRKGGE